MNVNGVWKVVATDSSWETKFKWARSGVSESVVTIEWDVPASAATGQYRIRYYGDHRNVLQQITPFTGTSSAFNVVASTVKNEKRGIRNSH